MKKRRFFSLMVIAVTSLTLAIGLSLSTPPPVVAQSNTKLLVSAAASLKDVMAAIKTVYQQSKPNIYISYNFGASGAL